jgi:transposase
MMGTKERTLAPIAAVSLDALVPADHFYRHLADTLDLSFVRDLVYETYAAHGRPSIDPEVFFKLQLVLFFEDIRSERLLMRLVADRLSIRWYLGYNLDEPLPDHSSLSRIRTRYGLAVFRRFFEAILEQCRQAKLIWGQELFFDATQVNANAALDSLTPRFAVEAHLAALFGAEVAEEEPAAQEQAPTMVEGSATAPAALPLTLPGALLQELAERNAARHDWIEQAGQQQRNVTHGTYQRMADFLVSTTDPDATAMRLKGGGKHLGYHTHYVVDGGKRRIILNVLVTPSEVMENQPMLDLLWRVQFRWKLRPHQATGDTTYGTLENIRALEDADIRAYVPLPDWSKRTPFFGPEQFRYDAQHDQYVCPNGARLRLKTHRYSYQDKRYLAQAATCNACPLKPRCTRSAHGRQITRHFDEQYLDRVRAYHQTAAYQKAMRKRKVWVEPLFAEAKDWHGLRRFRLRRLWRVNCEALLTAAGQNVKRLLQKRGWGRRPLPSGAALHFVFASLVLVIWGNRAVLTRVQGCAHLHDPIHHLASYQ